VPAAPGEDVAVVPVEAAAAAPVQVAASQGEDAAVAPVEAVQVADSETPVAEVAAPAPEAAEPAVDATAVPAVQPTLAQPVAPAGPRKPRFGGRKMQETLRNLREQWKQVDQGGPPNHALWKRFDEACNEAYKVVQEWLDKVKSEAAEHKATRLALLAEVRAWAEAHPAPEGGDWKAFGRALHQFGDRWREAGHLSEKAYVEMQSQWKEAIGLAAAPLEAAQKLSVERRHAMIEEARVLGEAPMLRIDAVKSLQQRWQHEAQSVPLDRKFEQKLWDTFRKPIDDAFNRKTVEREKAAAALSDRDRAVLDASRALDEATASGDAARIRSAMAALEKALRDDGKSAAAAPAASAAPSPVTPAAPAVEGQPGDAAPTEAGAGGEGGEASGAGEAQPPAAPPKAPPPKPVVAMRSSDDRPGGRRPEQAATGRPGGKFDPRRGAPGGRDARDGRGRPDDRRPPFGDRGDREDRGPRLGDTAFRAQRDAQEHAQMALRKLAAQAHGEALTHLLAAWEHRNAEEVPGVQELGRAVAPAVRSGWLQALAKPAAGDAAQTLLRLEIAAEVPTPAEHISARRLLQLQLLTRRNDPTPQETWGTDVGKVLATAYDGGTARRLQNALKALLGR
jgi:hypothetical protein